jgi:hypothetical protein
MPARFLSRLRGGQVRIASEETGRFCDTFLACFGGTTCDFSVAGSIEPAWGCAKLHVGELDGDNDSMESVDGAVGRCSGISQ